MSASDPIHIVGGGLAGSEAAWQAAEMGAHVVLHEMRPETGTFAHQTDGLAELVCSNSFRSDDDENNAVGLLHWEMRAAGGLIIAMADAHALPAGGALAVDREPFSAAITARLEAHPRITIARGEVAGLPPPDWSSVIIATGPLTSPALAEAIRALTDEIRARLLRRHRPHRAFRLDRPRQGLVPVALRQGRDRGRPHRLPQLPDGPRPVRGLHRRAARRRQDRVQGLGARHPLFRGLPADRGHGRARPRDPALRPDEADRPHQPPRAADQSPTPSSSSAATTRSARSTTSSASRPR